jgi:hypothetical protein
MIMASKAFTSVPRGALFCMRDPEARSEILLGLPKCNIGRLMDGTLAYSISEKALTVDGVKVKTAKLDWIGYQTRTLASVFHR